MLLQPPTRRYIDMTRKRAKPIPVIRLRDGKRFKSIHDAAVQTGLATSRIRFEAGRGETWRFQKSLEQVFRFGV